MNHKPQVIPVVSPQIDWGLFIHSMQRMTGESPTRSLDKEGIEPDSPYAFFKTLGPGEYTLKSLSYSFLIELREDDYLQILQKTDLEIVILYSGRYNQIVLISGTIYEWREACLEFCSEDVDIVLRYIFDCIYLYLHSLKLFTINKTMLKDQTFTLSLG